MTTEIMELWAEIAAGALPEGVAVEHDCYGVDVYAPETTELVSFKRSSDHRHRAAMLLIVDGWERQGYEFTRWRGHAKWNGYKWLAKPANEDAPSRFQFHHKRETIALGNVLAELGRAVKEGQA